MRTFPIILLVLPIAAAAADPQVVTLSIDQDLLVLLKGAICVVGIILAIFAFIGVAFFGWDVRKARASIIDAQRETRDLLKELKDDFAAMKALKEKLEQTGAELEEVLGTASKEAPLKRSADRTSIDLIHEVINESNYDWTTIGRLVQRTALSRDQILDEVRKAHDIRIGNGRKTKDFIFRFNGSD
jgi:hypothetical protein